MKILAHPSLICGERALELERRTPTNDRELRRRDCSYLYGSAGGQPLLPALPESLQ
jgi:hypothetical protein